MLVIQHAKCMYCIMLSSLASMVPPYFYNVTKKKKKKHDLQENVTERKMYV
jgi:hypothetical protein